MCTKDPRIFTQIVCAQKYTIKISYTILFRRASQTVVLRMIPEYLIRAYGHGALQTLQWTLEDHMVEELEIRSWLT